MLEEANGVNRVVLVLRKTDMRRGTYGLASTVMNLGIDPVELGTLWVFCGRSRKKIKALIYEPTGFLLLQKEVIDGAFPWPRIDQDTLELSVEEFRRFLQGYSVVPTIRVPDISQRNGNTGNGA